MLFRASRTGSVSLREHLLIAGVGVLAVMYLAFSWRAVSLDAQLAERQGELARARFANLQARRDLYEALSPAALGADTPVEKPASSRVQPPDAVTVPALPPVETSVFDSAGGQADRVASQQARLRGPDVPTVLASAPSSDQ